MSDTKEIYLQYQIYLAEDDDGFQRLIELKLRKEGFSVKSFSDGNGLLEEIKNEENKFLVLLDYNLPDINGRNLIEKIKNIKNNSEFVVMTGYGDEKIAVDVMKLGAKDYLVKDINFIEMISSTIKQVIF